jgi:hypothetical protein
VRDFVGLARPSLKERLSNCEAICAMKNHLKEVPLFISRAAFQKVFAEMGNLKQ